MKSNENNNSYKNKIALFDKRVKKSVKIDLPKKDNSINKILEKFKPQKNEEIKNKKTKLNDSKENEIKENKQNKLNKETQEIKIQKIKESNSKINTSNNFNNTNRDNEKQKNQEIFESIKINDKKILLPQEKKDISNRVNISPNNSNILEMIKKLNQNEEKSKIVQSGNKGSSELFETCNKYHNQDNLYYLLFSKKNYILYVTYYFFYIYIPILFFEKF